MRLRASLIALAFGSALVAADAAGEQSRSKPIAEYGTHESGISLAKDNPAQPAVEKVAPPKYEYDKTGFDLWRTSSERVYSAALSLLPMLTDAVKASNATELRSLLVNLHLKSAIPPYTDISASMSVGICKRWWIILFADLESNDDGLLGEQYLGGRCFVYDADHWRLYEHLPDEEHLSILTEGIGQRLDGSVYFLDDYRCGDLQNALNCANSLSRAWTLHNAAHPGDSQSLSEIDVLPTVFGHRSSHCSLRKVDGQSVELVFGDDRILLEDKSKDRCVILTNAALPSIPLAKLAFHSARPCWIDPRIQDLTGWGGYGLPSGHVFLATALWFGAAKEIRLAWAWFFSGMLVFLRAISRLYLGVHSICDVVAGACFGLGLSSGLDFLEKRSSNGFNSWKVWSWLLLICWLASVFWLSGQLLGYLLETVSDPPTWSSYSSQARSLDGLDSSIRNFIGVSCMLIIAGRLTPFELPKAFWIRALVLIYALIGAKCLSEVGGWLPQLENEGLRLAMNIIKQNSINAWILVVLPWLLLKMGVFYDVPAKRNRNQPQL